MASITPRKLARREPIRSVTPSSSPSKPARREPIRPSHDPLTPTAKRTIESDADVTPKRLRFSESSPEIGPADGLLTPLTTPVSTPTAYSLGKALFQRGASSGIVGRDAERAAIDDFLRSRIDTLDHGAIYLSGVPGTGKSALLSEVVDGLCAELPPKNIHNDPTVRVATINCMIVDRPDHIFVRIHESLTGDKVAGVNNHTYNAQAVISDLDALFINSSLTTRYVVVLDELDHVVTRDQEVLFKIFQWAFMDKSSLILVGIANALDLTDRFLPRLRSNGLIPEVIAFNPYSAEEIAAIVKHRLRSLTGDMDGELPLMGSRAIELCARKTAANTGDLRKAFDICRRAIELVEEEVRRSVVDASDDNTAELPAGWKRALLDGHKSLALTSLSLHEAPKVGMSQIVRACASAFGGSSVSRVKALNLQQKAVLCVLVIYERSVASLVQANISVSKLFDKYTQICQRENTFARLSLNEFLEVISALESNGLVGVSGVCGRKGLGTTRVKRSSRGGGGAAVSGAGLGSREDYIQRKIASNVHGADLLSALSKSKESHLLAQFVLTG